MRKWLILIIVSIVFSSCTISRNFVSEEYFDSNLNVISEQILDIDDYKLIGEEKGIQTEVVVTGNSYSYNTGFTNSLNNSISNTKVYNFINSNGDNIKYEIFSKTGYDMYGKSYITQLKVTKCSCEDAEIYQIICGTNGIVKRIEKLNPDTSYTFYDVSKTYLATIGSSLAASLIIILLSSAQ